MMLPHARLWTILTLIISIAASSLDTRANSIVLGYRTVKPAEAQQYKKAGNTLVYAPSESSDQLGPGRYLTQTIAEWPSSDSYWDCAILADSVAWNLVNKAWLPQTDGCNPLWWNTGLPYRAKYLKELGGANFATSNTVLLSQIENFQMLQLLIPPQLLLPSSGLKIVAQCAAKTDTEGHQSISRFGPVNWSSWLNIKGTPQTVQPPAQPPAQPSAGSSQGS